MKLVILVKIQNKSKHSKFLQTLPVQFTFQKMSQEQDQAFNNEQQVTKQQQKPITESSKKLNSYTYWVDKKNVSRQLPAEQRPQKIEPPKLVNKPSDIGRSNWNTAGTWQHKTLSLGDIQNQYKQKLNEWLETNLPQFKLKTLSLKGQCQIVFIRTKKALTYQINGKVEFQKKPQQKKQQSQQEKQQDKNDAKNSSDQGSSDESPSKSSEKQENKKEEKVKPKKGSIKSKFMTLQLVDLTDHGDRQYKSKSDDAQCKKIINEKSNSLITLLEQILKSYK